MGGASGQRTLSPHITRGILITDWQQRLEPNHLRNSLPALPVTEPALVVTGMGAQLTYSNPHLRPAGKTSTLPLSSKSAQRFFRLKDREIYLACNLPPGQARLLQREGFALYYLSTWAPSYIMRAYGCHPADLGLSKLISSGNQAFWK